MLAAGGGGMHTGGTGGGRKEMAPRAMAPFCARAPAAASCPFPPARARPAARSARPSRGGHLTSPNLPIYVSCWRPHTQTPLSCTVQLIHSSTPAGRRAQSDLGVGVVGEHVRVGVLDVPHEVRVLGRHPQRPCHNSREGGSECTVGRRVGTTVGRGGQRPCHRVQRTTSRARPRRKATSHGGRGRRGAARRERGGGLGQPGNGRARRVL